MSPTAVPLRSPRMPLRTGARLRLAIRVALLVVATLVWSTPVVAQEPPDTVVISDTLVVADSLAAVDSLGLDSLALDTLVLDSLALDSLRALFAGSDSLGADSLEVEPDTIFYNIPEANGAPPTGFVTGIWEWDRRAIMSMGANTLVELLQETPGLIALLGGDYGTPSAMSFAGQGGGGYRIFRDGFELYPVEGGVVDLQHVPLVGISRVRLDRSLGQMVVNMWSHEYDDGRPFSVVEAGTGDLDTNLFRGVYTDPTALFGSIGAGLERMDTRGRASDRSEGGNRTGSWLRYQLHLRDRFGIGFDYRKMSAQTKVTDYLPTTGRTDIVVRAGAKIFDGVTLQAYGARSDFTVETDTVGTQFGGARKQAGATLGFERAGSWLRASYRRFEDGTPSGRLDGSAGYTHARWGGFSGRYAQGAFNDVSTSNYAARAWLTPIHYVTLFGAYEAGTFGSRNAPVIDGPGAPPAAPPEGIRPGVEAVTDRETFRVGASLTGWGVTLAGASLYAWSDVTLPLATELDLGSPVQTGVHRNGYEAMGILPTGIRGLTLEGSYTWWDEEGPYLPKQFYQGAFEFNRVFKESGNLEFWVSGGVRGHDPMLSFVAEGADGSDPDGASTGGLARVPFYQSWYGRLQVRVLTVRLWVGIDNFTLRRELQKYPERFLPVTRTTYAIRWDLWN